MAESGEYKYTIEIKLNSDGNTNANSVNSGSVNPGTNNAPSGNISNKDALKKFAPLLAIGHNAINFATSNIGTFTGNSRLQDQVNLGLKMVGYGSMIIANPVMGVVAMGTDIASNAITHSFNQKWKNRDIEQARYKVGYSATNRSR